MESADEVTDLKFTDRNGDVLRLKQYRGHLVFLRFIGNIYRETIGTMHVRMDDIFLINYPKSGTHWIYEVIHMLVNKTRNYCTLHGFLEYNTFQHIDNMASPRILSTHTPYNWLPKELLEGKRRRIIYLYRNPKDISVSLFHYIKQCSAENYNGSWSGFLDLFMKGQVPHGSWFEYMKIWEDIGKANPDILFVQYEDMKKNFRKELLRIANYLRVGYDEELFDEIEEKCSFTMMSKSPETTMSLAHETKDGRCPIYRKGVVGDWKNYFTVAQNEAFEALFEAEMKSSSLTFQFV